MTLPVDALLRATMTPGWTPDPFPSLEGVTEVAVDFETTGLRWWERDRPVGTAIAWKDPANGVIMSAYLPTRHDGGNNHPVEREREWRRTALRGKYLYNLNTKFDLHHSREDGVDLEEVVAGVGDVGHYAALLDDHRRHFSLEAISRDYLGMGKVQGLDMSHGAGVYPAHQVTPYGRRDAELVLRNLDAMRPLMAEQELQEVAALEDQVIWPTLEMERNGVPLDLEKLARWVKQSERDLTLLHLQIARACGHAVQPDSADSLARLFAERGLTSDQVTETGRPSFAANVLEAAAKRDPVVALVLRAARLADLRSKYLLAYTRAVDSRGILRCSFHQLRGDKYGAVSGRFSSSQIVDGVGANLQQVMAVDKQLRMHCPACEAGWRDRLSDGEKIARHHAEHPPIPIIRELYVPARGKRTAAADAKQIEYRIFADMTRSPRLLKAYEDDPDTDFHAVVGEMVHKYRPDFERKRVKNLNFAILFGAGVDKTCEMMGVTEAEGRELIAVYDEAFPEARTLMRLAIDTVRRRGYVRTIAGRRARFPKREREHSALNRAIQGSAGDINKKKLVEVYRERKRIGITLRITNHDEVVGDVEDDRGAELLAEVLDRQSYPTRVPILWDVRTGANWAECK